MIGQNFVSVSKLQQIKKISQKSKKIHLWSVQRICDLADEDEVEDALIVLVGGTGILQNPAASKTGSNSRTLPGIDPSNILKLYKLSNWIFLDFKLKIMCFWLIFRCCFIDCYREPFKQSYRNKQIQLKLPSLVFNFGAFHWNVGLSWEERGIVEVQTVLK